MSDIISHPTTPEHDTRTASRDWPLSLGAALSLLAITYFVVSLHARYLVVHANPAGASQSAWFPVQLFVIAVSPALAGLVFLWSERDLKIRASKRFLCNLGMFGFGLLLAAWFAMLAK